MRLSQGEKRMTKSFEQSVVWLRGAGEAARAIQARDVSVRERVAWRPRECSGEERLQIRNALERQGRVTYETIDTAARASRLPPGDLARSLPSNAAARSATRSSRTLARASSR